MLGGNLTHHRFRHIHQLGPPRTSLLKLLFERWPVCPERHKNGRRHRNTVREAERIHHPLISATRIRVNRRRQNILATIGAQFKNRNRLAIRTRCRPDQLLRRQPRRQAKKYLVPTFPASDTRITGQQIVNGNTEISKRNPRPLQRIHIESAGTGLFMNQAHAVQIGTENSSGSISADNLLIPIRHHRRFGLGA